MEAEVWGELIGKYWTFIFKCKKPELGSSKKHKHNNVKILIHNIKLI